jgi:hypothetical protein
VAAVNRRIVGLASAALTLATLAWLGACNSDSDSDVLAPPILTPSSFVVSDTVASPVPVGGLTTAAGAAGSRGDATVVYVSLAEGEIPFGTSASIRNWRTGSTAATPMVAGGFDPVVVEAVGGDTLEVTVEVSSGPGPLSFLLLVPLAAPPIVVRTEPADGKRDVPLNARIIIVFSEPIDGTTLTGTTVRFKRGLTVVAGTVHVADAEQLSAEFVPAEPLAAATGYELEITQGVRDLDGEALTTALTVNFTTGAEPPPPPALAFVSDRTGADQIYVANSDGTGVTRLTNGERPALSWDGRRIAFHRTSFSTSPPSAVTYVMNTDGTGERVLAEGEYPAWSPDGSKIAVSLGAGIAVIDAEGSGFGRLINEVFMQPDDYLFLPAWSPDGQRLAFVRAGNWFDVPSQTYIMNADGSELRPLVSVDDPMEWYESEPAWSPDGSLIVYDTGDSTGEHVVASLAWDGTGSRTILYRRPTNSYYSGNADWSPDGVSRWAHHRTYICGRDAHRRANLPPDHLDRGGETVDSRGRGAGVGGVQGCPGSVVARGPLAGPRDKEYRAGDRGRDGWLVGLRQQFIGCRRLLELPRSRASSGRLDPAGP